jgi:CheY-like chemotaxis protein
MENFTMPAPVGPSVSAGWSGRGMIDTLTDNSQLFLFAYSPTQRSMLSWSRNAARILGVRDQEIAGDRMLFLRHVHPQDRMFLLSELARSLREKCQYIVTYRWIRPDNQEIRMLHCRAATSAGSIDPAFEGVILDISNEFPSALGRSGAGEAVESYLSGEFQRSLQSIAQNALQIAANPGNSEIAMKAAQNIREIAERGTRFRDQLVATQQPGQSYTISEISLLDLNVISMTAINRIEDLCSSGMKVAVTFGDAACIHGRSEVVAESIEAILRDARISMPKGGLLNLKTSQVCLDVLEVRGLQAGHYAKVMITYNSVNGLACDRRRISELMHSSFERPYDGMRKHWLAMARSMALVQSMGGALTIERHAWSGMTICLYFPLANGNRAIDTDRLFIPDVSKPPRIMILDDDLVVLRAIAGHLAEIGFTSVVAEDYSRAMNFMKSFRQSLDLVVLDTFIRGSDQIKTIRSLKRMKEKLMVIGYSNSAPDDDRALIEAGALEILPKPIHRQTLQDSVRRALGLRYLPRAA